MDLADERLLILTLVLVGLLGIAALAWRSRREKLRIYGDAWREFNARAFHPITEPSPDERFEYVTRLAVELATAKGQLAVSMKTMEGWAIHHINKNGTFAQRGPYFVSSYRGRWRPTGRKLLIRTMHGRGGHGFKPDHYNQHGHIWERGVAVLEYDTQRHSEMSLGDFVAMQRRHSSP